jgi:trans-2,3-dihydro-3-hydroxyanthranilate isomerase
MKLELEPVGDLHPYYVLDVFTDTPLEGNQLGVFPDGEPFSGEQMQRIARELNVSETIFLLPPEAGGDARIRIFTPGLELPFAGHPVLGASFVVGEALGLDEVRLETGNGTVPIRLERSDGRVVFGWMEQPPFPNKPYDRADEVLTALGLERSLLPVEVYVNGPNHVFVQLPDEASVAALDPDFGALAGHDRLGTNCFAGSGTRWKTRMFSPSLGVAEDPATGSAAAAFAGAIMEFDKPEDGEHAFVIEQGDAMGRPSRITLRLEVAGAKLRRARIGGEAVIMSEGILRA